LSDPDHAPARPRRCFALPRRPLSPSDHLFVGDRAVAARLRIETTLAEIVDIDPPVVSGDRDGKLARCLEEAAWNLDLDSAFHDPQASFSIEL
jgi:hypothetical protein